jgi:hypothetical protein
MNDSLLQAGSDPVCRLPLLAGGALRYCVGNRRPQSGEGEGRDGTHRRDADLPREAHRAESDATNGVGHGFCVGSHADTIDAIATRLQLDHGLGSVNDGLFRLRVCRPLFLGSRPRLPRWPDSAPPVARKRPSSSAAAAPP